MFPEIGLTVQLALGVVFLLSATGKLRDPAGFARGLADYQILPGSIAYAVGILVIVFESGVAIAHLTGRLLVVAVPLGCGMFASFTVAVSVNLARGRALPCYCFSGRGGETISGRTLTWLLLVMACEVVLLADPTLFKGSPVVSPLRWSSLSQAGLAFLWATLLLLVGSWFLNLPEVISVLRSGKTRPATVGSRAGQPSTDRPSEASITRLG